MECKHNNRLFIQLVWCLLPHCYRVQIYANHLKSFFRICSFLHNQTILHLPSFNLTLSHCCQMIIYLWKDCWKYPATVGSFRSIEQKTHCVPRNVIIIIVRKNKCPSRLLVLRWHTRVVHFSTHMSYSPLTSNDVMGASSCTRAHKFVSIIWHADVEMVACPARVRWHSTDSLRSLLNTREERLNQSEWTHCLVEQ